ncbi:MAG: hypothetical protein L0271_12855 [Gemmatimonadetes bacterium]|nr:hypothetical protein [Gemmatimonadota bacterium]
MKTSHYRTIGLIALMAVVIHLDWHIGRELHHGLSFAWPYHWVLGLVSFAAVTWRIVRVEHRHAPVARLLTVLVGGLIAGQLVEPWLETVIYRETWAAVMPVERWRIFAEFTAAGAVGSAVVLASGLRARARPGNRPA